MFLGNFQLNVRAPCHYSEYRNICECFDKFATLRGHGYEHADARRDFFAAVRGASHEKLHELDHAVDIVCGEDVISRTLRFVRQKHRELKEERKRRRLAAQVKRRSLPAPISA
jgi:hypothetical protein